MKNQMNIWIGVLSALVVILLIVNISTTKNAVPVTKAPLFEETPSEPKSDYVFMNDEADKSKTGTTEAVVPLPQTKPVGMAAPVSESILPKVAGKVAFTIQAVSLADPARAEEEWKKAQAAGLPANLVKVVLGTKGIRYRIYVGKFTTKAEADEWLPKVKSLYSSSFIIIPKDQF